jgi:hypothetical protein
MLKTIMQAIHALFPKVRSELVRLLFADPGTEYHLRDLARRASLAIGTVQKEVAHLSEAGLLNQRRDGNRLYIRANADHPIFPELHGLAQKSAT